MTCAADAVQPGSNRSIKPLVVELCDIALQSLPRMYRPSEGLFAFRVRRHGGSFALEGSSRRYTAIVLIGLAGQTDQNRRRALAGGSAGDLCRRLLNDAPVVDNLGDIALTLWAAFLLGEQAVESALKRLLELDPFTRAHPTVELAWVVTALSVNPDRGGLSDELAGRAARRLLNCFRPETGMFPHWLPGGRGSLLRSHVACFADFVYPIQALAHYYRRSGDRAALEAARRSASRMCDLQGSAGQWWWHFDIRTGRAIEGYPVYAVHQNSMAPMALLDLQDAGGDDHTASIARGLRWLEFAPELQGSLIDRSMGFIWRKVARHEPGKLARTLQAVATRIHPSLRVPGVDWLLKPGWVDFESRPYHMGWILYAWPDHRIARLDNTLAAHPQTTYIGPSASLVTAR